MLSRRSYDLAGEVALVTGAGRGMCRGIAHALAAWGAAVAVTDIDEAGAQETVRLIEAEEGRARAYRLDVTDEAEAARVAAACVADLGGIDLLVNGAGLLSVSPVVDMELEDWRRVMDVNISGVFIVSRAVAREMLKRGTAASIVSISSVGGRVGERDLAHYSASKFAVIGFTQSLAKELADNEIYVNAICPGSVDTPMLDDLALGLSVTKQDLVDGQLIKRFLTGEDMAHTIAFLHTSRAITGQSVNTDGGLCFN